MPSHAQCEPMQHDSKHNDHGSFKATSVQINSSEINAGEDVATQSIFNKEFRDESRGRCCHAEHIKTQATINVLVFQVLQVASA